MQTLLPDLVFAGFECSSPIGRDGVRIDEIALTRHDAMADIDYAALRSIGISTCREGVRWNLVDRRGALDWTSVIPFIEAANRQGMTVIWDLFHYGYPDDLDPFGDSFVDRFRAYALEFARILAQQRRGARRSAPLRSFYTPVNEIGFLAWAGGEAGWFAPHGTGCASELKRQLARAAIAGVDAIRSIDLSARFVSCEPIVHVEAPADEPDLARAAERFNQVAVYEAWDMLAGRTAPELGGSPDHLDIVGVNYYGVNQWELGRPDSVLAMDDLRRVPFSDLLIEAYRRYGRPMIVTETSSIDADRSHWVRGMARECRRAMRQGVNLHGFCIYPAVGMADWHTGAFRRMGIWDEAVGPAGRALYRPLLPAIEYARAALRTASPSRRRQAVVPAREYA